MPIPRSAQCGLDQQLYPSQFKFNEIAAIIATIFVGLACCVYCWNIVFLFKQLLVAPPEPPLRRHPRKRKHLRSDVSINSLSALLAAAVGIVVIFATWPQPLEGAALLIIVLSQASALDWQNHDLDIKRGVEDLIEKVPDVLAVIVAAYTLLDGRKKYLELNPENGFMYAHDPEKQVIFAFVMTAAAFTVGLIMEFVAWGATEVRKREKLLQFTSFAFFLIQVGTVAPAIGFGATTIAGGCAVFNATKVTAIITLGAGVVYSLLWVVMRLKLSPVV